MISVIIPVYNAAERLERTLECVKKQSFSDFEVIMIDDGSCDNSAKICENFQKKDSRFKYFHQDNSGVSSARNNGLKYACGEYIAFLDADDIVPENYLSSLMNAVCGADIAVCDVIVQTEGEETCRFSAGKAAFSRDEALNLLLSRRKINSGPYAKLFKKSLIENIKFPKMKAYEDMLFNLEAFSKAEKISSTDDTGYYYVYNCDGAMSAESKKTSCDIAVASEKIMDFLKNNPQLDPECTYITLSYLLQCAGLPEKNGVKLGLVRKTKLLFRKSIWKILFCPAFPKKEKILFILFAFGFYYRGGNFISV